MLIVAGTLRIEPTHREAFFEAVHPMVETTLTESGCHQYAFTPDPFDPGLIHLFEVWESQAALDEHFASAHMASWRQRSADLPISDRAIFRYEVSSHGPMR